MSVPEQADECCYNCYFFWSKLSSCHDDKTDTELMWTKCKDYQQDE